jgi:hypothetical protein
VQTANFFHEAIYERHFKESDPEPVSAPPPPRELSPMLGFNGLPFERPPKSSLSL